MLIPMSLLLIAAGLALPVGGAESPQSQPEGRGPWSKRFKQFDRDGNGVLTPGEVDRPQLFNRLDANKDGKVTAEEARAGVRKARPARSSESKPALPPPTHKNVPYGPHARNVLDLWQAKPDKPAPLVVFIHGGGFRMGDKSLIRPAVLRRATEAGASVMSINYRFLDEAPIQDILRDCARAIQFARREAVRFNVDPKRVASFGGSAGAGTSLWLAVHDDLADPKAEDPVLRESSRIRAAACLNGQATYDLTEWERVLYPIRNEWRRNPMEFADFYRFGSDADLETERGRRILADCSMVGLLSADDPPLFMACNQPAGQPKNRGHLIHHPGHVEVIRKRAGEVGVSVKTHLTGGRGEKGEGAGADVHVLAVEFLLKHLGVAASASLPAGSSG